jgi:hypothetical protein
MRKRVSEMANGNGSTTGSGSGLLQETTRVNNKDIMPQHLFTLQK